MRVSIVSFALALFAAQRTHARPVDTSALDDTVSQVEVPDTIQYVDCDPKDPYCGECIWPVPYSLILIVPITR